MKIKNINRIANILFRSKEYKNWIEIIRLLAIDKKPSKVVLKNGVKIEAENRSILRAVKRIFFNKTYNPVNFEIGKDDTVVDIGANIGVFTLFAATKTDKAVYSFEPFPENFKFLDNNVKSNGFTKVFTHAAAVCDKVGTMNFNVAKGNTAHHIANYSSEKTYAMSIEVPTLTLKHIIDQNHIECIDFLKLDCEGAEGDILLSTPLDYLKRVRKLAMEFHDNISPLNHKEIEMILTTAGFKTSLKWNGKDVSGYLFARRD